MSQILIDASSSIHMRCAEAAARVTDAKMRGLLARADCQMIAACKQQSAEAIMEAMEAGLMHFGENRVQEAYTKWPTLKQAHPDVTLHLIGPLQSNKAHEAVALFDVIHTVDREKIARALRREMEAQGRELPCFIQVNSGEEPQKAGVAPKDVAEFLHLCREEVGLNIVGLMCVPPADQSPAPHFALLHTLAKAHGLPELSMGMSGDCEEAIRFGASYVRIGTALFGPRG